MTDLAPLHRRLRRALDLSSLLVLGALVPACAGTQDGEPASQGKTEVAKTDAKTDANKTDAKTDTKITPPPEPIPEPIEVTSLPRCPTVDWCGSPPVIEVMGVPPDMINTVVVDGCPSLVQRKEGLDPKLLAGQEPPPPDTTDIASYDAEGTKAKRAAGDAKACCYEWTIPCPGGRPLLIEGRPWVAGLRSGRAWSAELPQAPSTPALPEHVRERIADAWLRDALTEHASIASFARARAELAAISAPAELLGACERAAEDEVEHARLCFALAERLSGLALEPTPLPVVAPRGGDAIAVALDTFVEGCVGETIAAACARRAAASAADPVVRAVLERIAGDETEHAALAWRTIAWLARREGPRVLAAIVELADALRPEPIAEHDHDPDAELLLAHGRLDRRTLAQTRALAWREIVDPLLAELGATASLELRANRALPS